MNRFCMLWIALLVACKSSGPAPASPAVGARSLVTDAVLVPPVVEGLNRFALAFYGEAPKEGNALYSPFSVATALSLVELGSAQESAEVLHTLLGASSAEEYRLGLRGLLLKLWGVTAAEEPEDEDVSGDVIPPYVLNVASSLWAAHGYPLTGGFAASAREHYRASVDTIDVSNPGASATKVNAWVSRATSARIKAIASPESITDLTRMLLVNVVYFRGSWLERFSGVTKDRDFYLQGVAEPVLVPTMHRIGYAGGMQDAEVSILELGYASTVDDVRIAMTLIIPKEKAGLAEVEDSLSGERLGTWLAAIEPVEAAEVWLPKWRAESSVELGAVLSKMGIGQLFSDDAEFSGISKKKGLRLSEVMHKTFIEVDEVGTEAAAATEIIGPCGIPDWSAPTEFRIDRPFLYLIRDTKSGVILFVGRVTDPRLAG